jgi:hypothetical protein
MKAHARLVWIVCLLFTLGSPAWSSAQQRPDREQSEPQAPTVSGRVIGTNGRPAHDVTIWIGRESDGGFSAETCMVNDDGTFVSPELSPGTYVLDASAPSENAGAAATISGFAPVVVRDSSVNGVVLSLQPSIAISGHVRFESEREGEPLHPRVSVRAVLAVERMRENHSTVTNVAEDGTFTLAPLHGPRLIRADAERGSSPSPWWLKTVLLDGVDVTNVPIDFATKPSARLEVVFSDRPTAVVGIVHDEAGLPVESARVVLFSKDPALWAAWSTAVQAGISDENGRFWFVDAFPAGDYRAIALRDGPPVSIAEAVDQLPRLEKFAMPIVVSESKVARIEVIISRPR